MNREIIWVTLMKSHQPFKKHRFFSGWEQKGKPESLKAQELLEFEGEAGHREELECDLQEMTDSWPSISKKTRTSTTTRSWILPAWARSWFFSIQTSRWEGSYTNTFISALWDPEQRLDWAHPDFWPIELWDNKWVWLEAAKPMVVCYVAVENYYIEPISSLLWVRYLLLVYFSGSCHQSICVNEP